MHSYLNNRPSWDPNGEEAWYIRPYRCVNCYFPQTRAESDVGTVTFFLTVVPFLEVITEDFLKQVALDIIFILTTPPSTTTVSLKAGDKTHNELSKIAESLQKIDRIVTLPPTTSKSKSPAQLPRVNLLPIIQ